MKLTIVGSSGSMSGPNNPASSYLVQAQGRDEEGCERTYSLLLDLGPGSMGGLLHYLDPAELDGILISHCHADHMVDMIGMHVYRRWNPAGALGPVPTYGPSSLRARLNGVDGTGEEESYATEFTLARYPLGESFEIGPFTVTAFEAQHPVEAYGIRVEGPAENGEGRVSLAYTGDTDFIESIAQMADGVDLLLAEAAFLEGRDTVRGMHLTGKRAGQLAAGVSGVQSYQPARELVLTHIQPWTDPADPVAEAREVFDGPVSAARPGDTWIL